MRFARAPNAMKGKAQQKVIKDEFADEEWLNMDFHQPHVRIIKF